MADETDKPMFCGIPIEYVPALDDGTDKPIYALPFPEGLCHIDPPRKSRIAAIMRLFWKMVRRTSK